jgi:uncharacterized protein
MSNTSDFRDVMRDVKYKSIIGPNVIANALPYLAGGLLLTVVGTYGGLGSMKYYPNIFFPFLIAACFFEVVLFFVARAVAEQGNNEIALPLLALYSLLTGYTLGGIVFFALRNRGIGITGIAFAAVGCGIVFMAARNIGSNLSQKDGMALTKTISLGLMSLFVALIGQFVLSLFGWYIPSWVDFTISSLGVCLFAGAAVVDFYILPRIYRNHQYLSAALSMYLTYINLFIFILRLLPFLRGHKRRK